MQDKHDWSRFTVRINLNAPAETLYRAWATRAGIEHWFLRLSEYKKPDGRLCAADEYVEAGDSYKWLWHGWSDDTVEKGDILKANGKDVFAFTFGKAGICTVKIYKEESEQIVELIQEEIPTDEQGKRDFYVGCKTGWTFYLANMKSLFEGGIDLRNRNERLQQMLNS